MSQNIGRVDHVVYICKPENQTAYVDELSKLCNVSFYGPIDLLHFGVRIYINWAAGLEVVTPLSETEMSKWSIEHLDKRGEGILGIVFGVENIEESRRHAATLGYDIGSMMELMGDEPYAHETLVFRETIIGSVINSLFVFGEIKLSDNPLR